MRTTYQSSSSQQTSSRNQFAASQQRSSNIGADLAAEKEFFLKYASLGN